MCNPCPIQELLHSANLEDLKNWIEQQVNTKDENELTALHKASRDGDLEKVKYLIQIGAQIEAQDNESWTPLHFAADRDHLEIVQYLIDHGAQIEAKTQIEQTPLIFAVD